jgi:hypothetical protein
MAGLGPAIHEKSITSAFAFVDARPKAGHDVPSASSLTLSQ